MSVRRTVRRVWETYRLLRVASYTAGALAGVGGLAGACWTLLARRMRVALSEDSPEYAADTTVDPWHAGEHAAGLIRAFRDVRIMAGARLVPILCLSGLLIVLLILMNLRMPKPDNPFVRDPVRLFSDADRTWIRMAAGGRCEHRGLFGLLRCRKPIEHMDHHYPWSRGGATDRHNLVGLCARHNLRKSDGIPTLLCTWLLYRARLKYFPARLRGYAWPDGRAHSVRDDDRKELE